MSNETGSDDRSSGDALDPLPGELGIPDIGEPQGAKWSKKGLLAALLLIGSVVAVAAASVLRLTAGDRKAEASSSLVANRPAAATSAKTRLDLSTAASTSTHGPIHPRIPALEPAAQERVEPIGVRRTGPAGGAPNGAPHAANPEDAPVLLVSSHAANAHKSLSANPGGDSPARSVDMPTDAGDRLDDTRRNLDVYQRQLRGILDSLTASVAPAAGAAPSADPPLGQGLRAAGMRDAMASSARSPSGGPDEETLQHSTSARVAAGMLRNRSLTLPRGTTFTCALKTRVISATAGQIGCQVQRNVYGDDGRVLLIERGSHLDGEYHTLSVRPGTVRIPVVWTRLRTPQAVTVDLESPGTGQLGESGIDGYVDNRWSARIGAAMLLSLIDDSVKLIIQDRSNRADTGTVVLPSTTGNTSKLAEKVLDSTINLPPLIYRNQGEIVGIYVARDIDFSSVYELKPVPR